LRHNLNDHLSRAGASYVHHWLEGDVVIADNLRVAHRATPISMDQHRILDRTTIRADGVYWGDGCSRADALER
jgi:alpha-ketoglutarate-dependent taurine dioxygenase